MDSDAQQETTSNGVGDAASLPLFYRRPEALNVQRHASLGLTARADFSFARAAHAVPVVAAEMPSAMRSYPIVFVGEAKAPVVITGLRKDENLFVEADGRWAEPHHIPAYVRRYPFILADDPQKPGTLALCIDRASERVVETGGAAKSAAFFDGSEPSEATKQALAFCGQFQRDFLATRAMVEKIDEHGLFAERQSKVTLPGGETLSLTDFQVIDEAALNALSDAAFLDLRKSGALALVYCHLASVNSWPSLAHRAGLRS